MKKKAVVDEVKKIHPRSIDMHEYVSKNESELKSSFMRAYNCKCSYCGLSIDVISREIFEIDHFIHKSIFKTKAQAGYIENLVLSCYACNRKKGAIEFPKKYLDKLHPDNNDIKKIFIRDDKYHIKISNKYKNNKFVKTFYEKLELSNETRRLDYLLMTLIAIKNKLEAEHDLYIQIDRLVDKLKRKRNIF